MSFTTSYEMASNQIEINGDKIDFSVSAEHFGMLRSTAGNTPTILARITAHKKALGAVLHTGMARGHRGNPAASLHVEELYAIPVLLSGIAPLVLSDQELTLIEQHHKETLRCLLRLHQNTPRSVIYFLAGSLPGSALLHLRQLSIFGMITRLKENVLHEHAVNVFSSVTISPSSWFHQIRKWCLLYNLPHPLQLLTTTPLKASFKNLVKKHVISYWEDKLRAEAAPMSSLIFFSPSFMSITKPHPLWQTAGSSPAKVSMATVQAQMLSGRYRTEALCSHWSKNKEGVCLLSSECGNTVEDLPHILSFCPSLTPARTKLNQYTLQYSSNLPDGIKNILMQHCSPSSPTFINFLLDCTSLPDVISAVQVLDADVLHHLFNISRTWVYVLHRERLKQLGRWNLF